jgi:single-stranded DNA-binding protein
MRIGEFFEDVPAAVPVVEPPAVSLAWPSSFTQAQQAEALALIKDRGHLEGLRALVADVQAIQDSPLLTKLPANKDECHKLSDLVVRASKLAKQLEESREARVKSYNAIVKRINGLFGAIRDEAKAAREKGDRLFLEFGRLERQRIEREEAEARRKVEEAAQRQAEADAALEQAAKAAEVAQTQADLEAAEAQAKEAEAAREAASRAVAEALVTTPEPVTRGYKGNEGTLSIKTTFKLDSFDPDKLPPVWFRKPAVLEAVRKELAKAVKAGVHDIPGTVVVPDESTQAR